MKDLRPAIVLTILFTVFTGMLFPAVIWAGAQLLFPYQANGSLIRDSKGAAIGSELIGQMFFSAGYFHPRPSAAGSGYDAAGSSGTNLGPISSKLVRGIADDPASAANESFSGILDLAKRYREVNALAPDEKIPPDAVTRSASGLDPHISPANAALQTRRVAAARGRSVEEVAALVEAHVEGRFFGVLGESRVNVLKLNLALDAAGSVIEGSSRKHHE